MHTEDLPGKEHGCVKRGRGCQPYPAAVVMAEQHQGMGMGSPLFLNNLFCDKTVGRQQLRGVSVGSWFSIEASS